MRTALLLGLFAAGTTFTGPEPERQWDRGYAVADCAPWDGAATSIFLTNAPMGAPATYPFLRLTVYHDLHSVAGARWNIAASGRDAAQSVLCDKGATCAAAAAGWIDLARRSGNEPLRGEYEARFGDGRRLAGRFTAPVRATRVLCG